MLAASTTPASDRKETPGAAPERTPAVTTPTVLAERLAAWGAGLALLLGSALFLGGGRLHPAINSSLGSGPEAFFRGFAAEVAHTHGWEGMHMMILLGPLIWAVAAPSLLEVLVPPARRLAAAARAALLLAAALWGFAFALDGFAAPVYARVLADAQGDGGGALITVFQANAIVMSRLGLVSWVAGGLGIVALGGTLLSGGRTPWRIVVATTGVALGVWPLAAALEGEYAGGPFVSGFWMWNALAVGLWYAALASCALGQLGRRTGPVH